MNKNIGIFGGSFDPPHIGHALLADYARETLRLDRLYIVPASVSPFKSDCPPVSLEHRLAMASLNFPSLCDIYKYDETPSYAYYTLLDIKRLHHPSDQFYWIGGSDLLQGLEKWFHIQDIVKECNFAIFDREGYEQKIEIPNWLTPHVHMHSAPKHYSSSSSIRDMIQNSSEYMGLYPSVAEYIKTHHLYV